MMRVGFTEFLHRRAFPSLRPSRRRDGFSDGHKEMTAVSSPSLEVAQLDHEFLFLLICAVLNHKIGS